MTDVLGLQQRKMLGDIATRVEQQIHAQDPKLFFALFMEWNGES